MKVHAPIADDYTPHPAVSAPTDLDRVEPPGPTVEGPSVMLGEIARNVEELMLADLRFVNGYLEPDDDPSMAETISLSNHVTLPTLDDREPDAVPMVAPAPRPMYAHAPIPPLFAPGGVPPGPAELRAVLRTQADELADHSRTLLRLALADEPPGYVAGVLAYREGDVSGVATKLGMLSRLFARLGIEGDGRPKGA